MDAFTSILGTFGKDLGGITKAVSPITSLFGMINQFSLAQKEKAAMDRSLYYAKHPEAVSNMVTAATKPLSSGLTTGVENVVNASLAEQGLSQAPGIQSQVLSQALAPYQQQEQQLALEQVLKTIGLPNEALAAIQSTMRPDQLAQMLKGILPTGPTSPSAAPSPSSPGGFQIPSTDPSGGSWGTPPSDTGISLPDIFAGVTANG